MNDLRTPLPAAKEELREAHLIGPKTREWLVTRSMSPALTECGLYLCGWSEAQEGFRFVRPGFPMAQVMVCTAGVGSVYVNGVWRDCGPGMAYITPPHVFHAYFARPDSLWNVYWATYHAPLLDAAEPYLIRAESQPFCDAIRHLYAEATGVADKAMLSRWTHLVHTCAERIIRPISGDPRLHRLWEAVRAAPDYPWTNAEMAKRAGISAEHLRRLCQQEVGHSPMEQVTRLRMQHAVSLFASGRYSVAAAAERVGYSTPYAFSAAFKRVLGVPPTRYVEESQLVQHREWFP